MPKWLKFLLVLAAVGFVALALLGGGIALWLRSNKDRLLEASKNAGDEGRSFAVEHTRTECLDNAVARLKECGGFDLGCEVTNKVRLGACIEAAKDDGLCASVPPKGEIWKIALWSNQECDQRGRHGSQPCQRVMQGVPEACATGATSR